MTVLRPSGKAPKEPRRRQGAPNLLGLYVLSRTGLAAVRVESGAFSEDPMSLAMMLGAVSEFVRDALHRGSAGFPGILRVVEGSRGFCMVPQPRFGLIAVYEGPDTEGFLRDLGALAARIEKQAGALLANWDGDLELMQPVERTVREYLAFGAHHEAGPDSSVFPAGAAPVSS